MRRQHAEPDGILAAEIAATAARLVAAGGQLSPEAEAAAVTALEAAAGGRADLLAQRAGLALGYGESQPDAGRYRLIADLCIKAGADEALIPKWTKTGRWRAEVAAMIPFSGSRR
jgi:hypothetical protein